MRLARRRFRVARAAFALLFAAAALAARAEGGASGKDAGGIRLEIGRAQELARSASDEVRAKNAAAEAALKAVEVARSNFFPKLSASVSGAYLANPPKGVTVAAGSLVQSPIRVPANDVPIIPDAKDTYFKGSLTFTQPLFVWGRIKAGVALASLEAEAAGIGGARASLDSLRSANRAYYSALLSRQGASILEELRAMAASILEDRRSAMDEGFATKEDILSSTADLAALDTRLVQAREGEASSLEALGLLTSLEPSSLELVSAFREALPEVSERDLKESSLGASADFAFAKVRLSQAKRKLELERGSSLFLPDLSLFASLDVAGQDMPLARDAWKDTWIWNLSLGLAAKADFFDGGASAARKGEASAALTAASIGAAAAEKAARLQARRALETAREAEASLREKEARAAWAAESLRNARAKAEGQAISRSELNAEAIGEATARLDLLYARYALEEAIADLERVAGRLFE